MKKTSEWGEFFPASMSPFDYQETMAEWYYHQGKVKKIEAIKTIDSLPVCKDCGKNYKLVSQELDFYKKMALPLPIACSECRHKKRFVLRNPRKLWQRVCAQCSKEISTTYAPDRLEKVLCELCYLSSTV
jgi:DNA-directed RNA polymerase subunit RPC12/RpoP